MVGCVFPVVMVVTAFASLGGAVILVSSGRVWRDVSCFWVLVSQAGGR